MNWIEALAETYDKQLSHVAEREIQTIRYKKKDKEVINKREVTPLLPLYHGLQNAHITILLDKEGNLGRAYVNDPEELVTIIPVSEDSESRAGSLLAPHPLCDKLQYVAGDALRYFNPEENQKKRDKQIKDLPASYALYIEQLEAWSNSDPDNQMLRAVLNFARKGRVIEDLISQGVLLLDEQSGYLLEKWQGDPRQEPPIFKVNKTGTPESSFIRWQVELGSGETRVDKCKELYDSWARFAPTLLKQTNLCYVTGENRALSSKFPKRIRNGGDGAKIISSNDLNGYTFRGRFVQSEEAFGLSPEVNFKAHGALRWLLSRQGYADGDQSILVWSPDFLKVPLPWDSSDTWGKVADEDEDEPFDEECVRGTAESVARLFRDVLRKGVGNLQEQFNELLRNKRVYLIALDSATPGRLSITRYLEFAASDYLANLLSWHHRTFWRQKRNYVNASGEIFYDGSPSLRMIIEAAFGGNVDEKLRRFTMSRLLPCVLQHEKIPADLEHNCLIRASMKHTFEKIWDWEQTLGVACSLYLYNHNKEEKPYTMSLDHKRNTRSYLYGRLWAVAEAIETSAQGLTDSNRPTNADRMMQRFQSRPYETWQLMETDRVRPYIQILIKNKPEWMKRYDQVLSEIMDLFPKLTPESQETTFEDNSPLDGSYLLGYHCQRSELYTKKNEKEKSEEQKS